MCLEPLLFRRDGGRCEDHIRGPGAGGRLGRNAIYRSRQSRPAAMRRRRVPDNKIRSGACQARNWTIDIAKRSNRAAVFEVVPRQWMVERTFA